MEKQTPAQGIMQTGDYAETKMFRLECNCHFVDHDVQVFISSEYGYIAMEVFSKVSLYSQGFFKRLKMLIKFLWSGHAEMDHTLLMNKQQALNFAEVIKDTIVKLEKFEKTENIDNSNHS